MSGSFTSVGEMTEYAHLIRLALRHWCPVPTFDDEVEDWNCALGARVKDDQRMGAGALLDFAELLAPEVRDNAADELELARLGFGARMAQTPGVIYSTQRAISIPIHIREVEIPVPPVVVEAFARLRADWVTPQNDELTDSISLYRAVRQLCCGFYYRWIWPDNVPDRIWLDARKHWHKAIRNNTGEEVKQLTMREPRAGDINRYGNPVRVNGDGEIIIEERKMTYMIAALANILPPFIETMDTRDWNSCAYRIRGFFLPELAAW